MGWIQLQLSTTPALAQELENLLEAKGSLAITLLDAEDQPVFEPDRGETPLWDNIYLTALFPDDLNPRQLVDELTEAFLPDKFPPVDIKPIENTNWERAWMKDFKPICFGEKLWICPSWAQAPDPAAVNIMLDPGLAFGTGTHPTTALCLNWLDRQNKTVIDYGCGSGILGIAALLLGAHKVIGVDNDPQALSASRDNARKNHIIESRFPVFLPRDFAAQIILKKLTQADYVLANILAGPLINLAAYLSALVKPGGALLLSGILEEQAESVSQAYQPWFDLKPLASNDGWVRISGQRKL